MPNFGRSVITGSSSTRVSGTIEKLHCRAMLASKSTPSIQAKDSPMHCLGPAPKGKYENLGRAARASGVQRSGSKRNGSEYQRGSRCVIHCEVRRMAFFG